MSAGDVTCPEIQSGDDASDTLLYQLEQRLERVGEWLNPILVKEVRQALKSRMFVVVFALMLIFGWGWSIFGVLLVLSPGVYYNPGGPTMLCGYFFVLAVPLFVAVPLMAFWSLAGERDDGTFELVSITSLTARQIVTGKMGSAIVQMIVFSSALSPCIAFTYLLRGIDIVTVFWVLGWTVLISILLSLSAICFATISRSVIWQVFLSVILVLAFLIAGISWSSVVVQTLFYGSLPVETGGFWVMNLFVMMMYLSFCLLFTLAAAGKLSFPSDNRSTKIRYAMIIQQLLWIGWMIALALQERDPVFFLAFTSCAGFYWLVMGALLSGESPQLSPRARRDLPQSFLGRMVGTWFNPGSGTGYIFAVTSFFGFILVTTFFEITIAVGDGINWNQSRGFDNRLMFAGLAWAYLTTYLGIGRLILLFLRKFYQVGIVASLLVQTILLVLGILLSASAQVLVNGFQNNDYTALQLGNWAWTLVELSDSRSGLPLEVPLLIFASAGLVFFVNVCLSLAEIKAVREATPDRVIQEEKELHPERFTEKRAPANPWSDDPSPDSGTEKPSSPEG